MCNRGAKRSAKRATGSEDDVGDEGWSRIGGGGGQTSARIRTQAAAPDDVGCAEAANDRIRTEAATWRFRSEPQGGINGLALSEARVKACAQKCFAQPGGSVDAEVMPISVEECFVVLVTTMGAVAEQRGWVDDLK